MRGILLKRQYITDFIEYICALYKGYVLGLALIYSCTRAHIYIYMYISRFCTDLRARSMRGILLRFISRVIS
jgi:hypothetical protein